MRVALTGATGIAGRALAAGLSGHDLVTLGRRPLPGLPHVPWDLTGPPPPLAGVDVVVHAAFSHIPGRYRGGEGDDPKGFLAANLDGTRRLFDAAAGSGVGHIVFLSSRAVFDGLPAGTPLFENRAPEPASVYGQAKMAAEAHLAALPLRGHALRATGLYGPGSGHKWEKLFADYRAGRPIAPRRGTELHLEDMAAACARLLASGLASGPVHASDLLLDRHDLLAEVRALTGCLHPPPAPDPTPVSELDCATLRGLGWRPRGWEGLRAALPAMI